MASLLYFFIGVFVTKFGKCLTTFLVLILNMLIESGNISFLVLVMPLALVCRSYMLDLKSRNPTVQKYTAPNGEFTQMTYIILITA